MLGPYRVPRNVMVYILFYRMHKSPRLWHMPEVFSPERWSGQGEGAADVPVAGAPARGEGEDELARMGKKYLPFSEGPRGCLGQARRLRVHHFLQASCGLGLQKTALAKSHNSKTQP